MMEPFVAVPSWERHGMRDDPHAPASSSERAPIVASPTGHGAEVSGHAAASGAEPGRRRAAGHPDVGLLGALAPYVAAGVTDLFVNGDRGLWVDRGGGAERVVEWSADERQVRALAVQLVARGGRHVDEATPAVDVRLGRGIRVHAVLPPISTAGTLVSVRIPRAGGHRLGELVGSGAEGAAVESRLRVAIARRENVLVTGAGGTGKTTLLGAMLAEAPPAERIVVIEDVAELQIDHPHVVSLEARQPNLEGSGRVGLDALVREALRMRPDRIVVGECRGAELRELLGALNTGHDGGAGTLHANSLDDVPARLEALGASAGMTPEAVARQAVSAIDLVVHLERRDGERRVAALGRLVLVGDRLTAEAGS